MIAPVPRLVAAVAGLALLALTAPAPAAAAPPAVPSPSDRACAGVRAHRSVAPALALDPRRRAPRVFAMQVKQDPRDVVTYAAFRRKVECAIRTQVLPHLAHGRPNLVVFGEDAGLATMAIGSRGGRARAFAAGPASDAACRGKGFPCVTIDLLSSIGDAYARPLTYYRRRFPDLGSTSGLFVAATDTFARGFMATFSDLARRYGIYVVAANDQAPFRETRDPAAIRALADPDLPRPRSVFVATTSKVHNEVFVWAPRDLRRSGPAMLRNIAASNRKVPLTPIEQVLQLTPGPAGGPAARANLRPYRLPGTSARLGFATSLPAFRYGDATPGADPCADVTVTYMRCLDRLGANVVIQADANPGPWTGPDGDGIEQWQPLSWMTSTWRATADPSVRFAYNVTPMLVGNLGDLTFDGQSAITQRGLTAAGCHYVGNATWTAGEDRPELTGAAGGKPEFLALAPWVVPDAPREALRAVTARLAPGSGDALENDYLETALVADLPFPPDSRRRGCVTAGR
jgi:hypothetical protein